MDLWRTADVLRRWWVLFVLFLVLACVAANGVLDPTPTYGASAQVLLKPVQLAGQNSLASLSPDLISSSTVVARALAADGYGGRLGVSTEDAVYRVIVQEPGATLQRGGRSIGPVLDVTVQSADPAVATATLDELLDALDAQLRLRQGAATTARASLVESSVLARTQTPGLMPISRSRAVVALGLLVGLGVLTLASAVESFESHLRPRARPVLVRRPRPGPGPGGGRGDRLLGRAVARPQRGGAHAR